MKRYFCKVSWQNPNQPLNRVHDNGFMEINFSAVENSWEVVEIFHKCNYGYYVHDKIDFCIDFMIEVK